MTSFTAIPIALKSIGSNKLRSILTLLGIVIGVGAVVSLMSVGRGAQEAITSRIQGIGTNLLFVRPGAVTEQGVRGSNTAPTLTIEDAVALADPTLTPAVLQVAPESSTGGQIIARGANSFGQVVGVTPDYESVRNYAIADGSFISDSHVQGRSLVAVLGATIAQRLFGEDSPVGQTVRINQRTFRVVGVLKSKGGTGLGNQDNVVLIPITTLMDRLLVQRTAQGARNVQVINVQAVSDKSIENAKEQITAVLLERHKKLVGEEDFTITTQQEALEALQQVTGVLTIFLGSIAGISLLVGGIGIMNIMLVSVTERIREIGLRKAVGAKRRDILLQFLTEATLLSLGGGALGLAAGWGISRLISGLRLSNQVITTVVSPDIAILALLVSVGIGLFFGVYPASRAAGLDPIVALRHE